MHTYVMNSESILFYSQICARNRNVSLCALNKLVRLCLSTCKSVQPRLLEFKKLRDKLAIPFGESLRNKIIGHPFCYTGKLMKIINAGDMLLTNNGVAFLNVDPPTFSEDFLSTTRVAFTDLSLISTTPISEHIALFIRNTPILVTEVRITDWLHITQNKYILHMNLPIRYNPITLGDPIISHNSLYFCVISQISPTDDDDNSSIQLYPEYTARIFTQAIVRFKTMSENAYDWTKYGLIFNGEMTSHPNTTSLVRPLTDLIEPAPDQQIDQ